MDYKTRKALKASNIEIHRNVFEEDNDYGDKAGDVYWTVTVGHSPQRNVSDPYYRRWRATDDAITHLRRIQAGLDA
jgi:hypothetical protein